MIIILKAVDDLHSFTPCGQLEYSLLISKFWVFHDLYRVFVSDLRLQS